MKNKYSDIIYLPRPTSLKRVPMRRIQRAAQFAPFAALTGHNAVLQATAENYLEQEFQKEGYVPFFQDDHFIE